MKHKRRHRRSEDESSEDERIIQEPVQGNVINDSDDEQEFLEDNQSQNQTQLVPFKRAGDANSFRGETPRKKDNRRSNGFRLKEVDVSVIPEHIIANLKRVMPTTEEEESDGLSLETWESAVTSSKGGLWILQCPKDVNVSNLLAGKKVALDGRKAVFREDVEDNADLTQYTPGSSLGANVNVRQFEAVSVTNEEKRENVVLLVPDQQTFKIVSAPVQGHIIIRESIEELTIPKIEVCDPKPRELPAGVKERHPIYGVDFTAIKKEMDNAPVSFPKKKKKSKGKEGDFSFTKANGYSNGGFCGIGSPLSTRSLDFKSDESDSSHKKKKKKKKKVEDDEESKPAVYMNGKNRLDNSYSQIVDFTTPYHEEAYSKSRKKSKKRKREEAEDEHDFDSTQRLLEVCEPSIKKIKRSKSMSRE